MASDTCNTDFSHDYKDHLCPFQTHVRGGPVFIMVEHFVISKLVELFGWQQGDGIFSPGGSMSNMYGLVLARYRAHPEVKRRGAEGGGKGSQEKWRRSFVNATAGTTVFGAFDPLEEVADVCEGGRTLVTC
ncbi:Acidic amino acid decarboxylase GADL1-like 4 [Homarus americanus]|uniref:Acidic amino acid decarboxylase GADL1-like 4 n=1 Tax=Homarus americanus TaxID=6706 RepID=A0A8J5NBJ5_HOMAM|nr:Acidic amino acid decarboxylase GADL1-like 4 [Homarus americanus]